MEKLICKKHGLTEFAQEKQDKSGKLRWRCKKCRYDRQVNSYKRLKTELVQIAGGKCSMCGYDKYLGALDFHHQDPSKKEFGISEGIIRYSKEKLIQEIKKCILLCKNCHAEVEGKGWF
jgi:5-methylcytosine-specific restriction endonuclease McrA